MANVIEILQRQIDDLRVEKNELKTELNQVRLELHNSRNETQRWRKLYAELKASAESLANAVERDLSRGRR